VGFAQHLHKVLVQVAGTGVTVWLVHHHQTALRPATTHGLDHGIHFPRMVAVVVDQHHAALVAQGELAMHLESAAYALEAGQHLNDGLGADALVRGHGYGRKRSEHVVHAGHVDEYRQRLAAFAHCGVVGLHALLLDIHGAVVGVLGLAEGVHLTVDLRHNVPRHRLIGAVHRQTVERIVE